MIKTRVTILTSLFLLCGSIIILISEFIPWVSRLYSPWYFFTFTWPHISSLIYLFPIVSAIITGIMGIIYIAIDNLNKKLISIVIFVSLSLLILFLIEMLGESGTNLYNSSGIYFGISGSAIISFGLFWMLGQESSEVKNN